MKTSFLFFALAVLVSSWAWGQDKPKDPVDKGKSIQIQGVLVDTSCYLKEDQKADEHDGMASCGKDCLNAGVPAGVLVGDKLYILIFPSKAFADHVGETVVIKGEPLGDNLIHPQKVWLMHKEGKVPVKLDGFEMM